MGIHEHLCIAWLLQRAWLHSGKVPVSRAASVPNQSCSPFSCHRSSTKWPIWDQEAATQPRHHRGHWPSSSCCVPAWHRFRGFCAEQTGLLRLPLRHHLREGIVWFMRWEEKIKLPPRLSFVMKGKKRVLLFLVAKECSLHMLSKGGKEVWRLGAQSTVLQAEPSPRAGSSSAKQSSRMWQLVRSIHIPWIPHPEGCWAKAPRWLGRPCLLHLVDQPFLSVVSCASQWGALFDGKSKMFAWPKMNFKVLNSPISHDKKWGCELMPPIYFPIYVLTANQKNNHTHNEVLSPTCFSHEWDCIFLVTGPGNFSKILF